MLAGGAGVVVGAFCRSLNRKFGRRPKPNPVLLEGDNARRDGDRGSGVCDELAGSTVFGLWLMSEAAYTICVLSLAVSSRPDCLVQRVKWMARPAVGLRDASCTEA